MFHLSKEDLEQLKGYAKVNIPPTCCGSLGKWVDHGNITGKYWLCVVCRKEIEHYDNVYGLTAAKNRQMAPTTSVGLTASMVWKDIDCTKFQCTLCIGRSNSAAPKIEVKVGDTVKCIYSQGAPSLIVGLRYTVLAIEPFQLRINVVNSMGMLEKKAYSRCRFQLEVSHAGKVA